MTCPQCSYQWTQDPDNIDGLFNLRKVDFFWINRDHTSFEWFVNLLSELEIEQQELGGSMNRCSSQYCRSVGRFSKIKYHHIKLTIDSLTDSKTMILVFLF